jgi:hypothetical protein
MHTRQPRNCREICLQGRGQWRPPVIAARSVGRPTWQAWPWSWPGLSSTHVVCIIEAWMSVRRRTLSRPCSHALLACTRPSRSCTRRRYHGGRRRGTTAGFGVWLISCSAYLQLFSPRRPEPQLSHRRPGGFPPPTWRSPQQRSPQRPRSWEATAGKPTIIGSSPPGACWKPMRDWPWFKRAMWTRM